MSFITGAVGVGRSAAVLAQIEDDGEPVDAWRIGFWRDGEWRAEMPLDDNPVALCPLAVTPDTWAVLSSEGLLTIIEDAIGSPRIRTDEILDNPPFAFTAIARYGTGLATLGMSRQVLWNGQGGWRQLGTGLPLEQPGQLIGFEAAMEFGNDLYAFGWDGEIWQLSNAVWRRIASPTNLILTDAAAMPSGDLIVTGQSGTLLRGRQDSWEAIDHAQTSDDFWSAASFLGQTYISSMNGIFLLQDDQLSLVDDGSQEGSYYRLSANSDIMISVGSRCVLMTDGDKWQRIV